MVNRDLPYHDVANHSIVYSNSDGLTVHELPTPLSVCSFGHYYYYYYRH